jgi:hypothetical protein
MAKAVPQVNEPVIEHEGVKVNKDTLAYKMLKELDVIYNAAYNHELTPEQRGKMMTKGYDELKDLIILNVSQLWD